VLNRPTVARSQATPEDAGGTGGTTSRVVQDGKSGIAAADLLHEANVTAATTVPAEKRRMGR
jgi:hypothetical protein